MKQNLWYCKIEFLIHSKNMSQNRFCEVISQNIFWYQNSIFFDSHKMDLRHHKIGYVFYIKMTPHIWVLIININFSLCLSPGVYGMWKMHLRFIFQAIVQRILKTCTCIWFEWRNVPSQLQSNLITSCYEHVNLYILKGRGISPATIWRILKWNGWDNFFFCTHFFFFFYDFWRKIIRSILDQFFFFSACTEQQIT